MGKTQLPQMGMHAQGGQVAASADNLLIFSDAVPNGKPSQQAATAMLAQANQIKQTTKTPEAPH